MGCRPSGLTHIQQVRSISLPASAPDGRTLATGSANGDPSNLTAAQEKAAWWVWILSQAKADLAH